MKTRKEKAIDDFINSSRDKTIDIDSDISSDTNSYTNSDTKRDIANLIKKQSRYTDLHTRKTYYIENELLKKIERLSSKNNLDKSFIVNEALRMFFSEVERMV